MYRAIPFLNIESVKETLRDISIESFISCGDTCLVLERWAAKTSYIKMQTRQTDNFTLGASF